MTYLQTRRNGSNGLRVRIYLAAGVIVVIAGIQILRPHFFPALFTTIVRPFWRVELAVELGSLRSNDSLLQDNAFMQRQLDGARVQLQSVQALETENTQLKLLLGRASSTPYILAAVLARPPRAPYDELVIDIGSDYSLATNDPVYTSGNVLIGRVSDVFRNTAHVTLFTSPGQKYDVLIGLNHAAATAFGRGGGQYDAELPRDIKVNEGDAVIVPSLNSAPFGIVQNVSSDPAQPFEKILFAPPINIYNLTWVLVDTTRTSQDYGQ